MNDWHDPPRHRHSVITIPVIWLAFVLSLVVHVAALWEWLPRIPLLGHDLATPSETAPPLSVRLVSPKVASAESPPAPKPAKVRPLKPSPAPRRPATTASRRAPPEPTNPPLAALNPPPSPVPPPPITQSREAAPPLPAPPPLPAGSDLSAYIAARRRDRGEVAPADAHDAATDAAAADIARRDRIVASNLASVNTQNFGDGPKNSGGIFQVTRLGSSDAEFTFFGWNKDIRRRASQRIEVQVGDNGDIRYAVVRRMIAIIREYETEDFVWESQRLGRDITLSARLADNAGLENFMMREFFGSPGPPQ